MRPDRVEILAWIGVAVAIVCAAATIARATEIRSVRIRPGDQRIAVETDGPPAGTWRVEEIAPASRILSGRELPTLRSDGLWHGWLDRAPRDSSCVRIWFADAILDVGVGAPICAAVPPDPDPDLPPPVVDPDPPPPVATSVARAGWLDLLTEFDRLFRVYVITGSDSTRTYIASTFAPGAPLLYYVPAIPDTTRESWRQIWEIPGSLEFRR